MKYIMKQVSLFCRLAVPNGTKLDVVLVGQQAAFRYYEGIEAKLGALGAAVERLR
jgi:hypothetical protein